MYFQAEASSLKEQKTDDLKNRDEIIKKLEQENDVLKIEVMKLHCKFENQSKEISEKSHNIQILNQKIRNSRPSSSYVQKHNKVIWHKLFFWYLLVCFSLIQNTISLK